MMKYSLWSKLKTSFHTRLQEERNWVPTEQTLAKLNLHKTFYLAFFYHYALFAIVVAFFAQPALKYANPYLLLTLGGLAGVILLFTYRVLVLRAVNSRISQTWHMILLAFAVPTGLVLFFFAGWQIHQNSTAHDDFCENLQYRITKGVNAESNSSIFNNMQCRFQAPYDHYKYLKV
jgi:predicted histidine transporter YuiF (NhaC family)